LVVLLACINYNEGKLQRWGDFCKRFKYKGKRNEVVPKTFVLIKLESFPIYWWMLETSY